jgi:polyphosphate kinase
MTMTLAKVDAAPTYRDRIAAFGADRFFNRELSWLEFNKRVLEEAENFRNPLLERLRFLAISGSNLDEFYRVRVAGLHEQAEMHIMELSADGLTPKQQVQKINASAERIMERQQARWAALRGELEEQSIKLLTSGSHESR